jgi:GntR family transcriptional regulator
VELGAVAAPAEVAERLRLDPGDQALIRRRRTFADDEPMQLATSYVPWSLAEGTQMTTEHTGPTAARAESDRDGAVAMTPWQHARTPWAGRAATA